MVEINTKTDLLKEIEAFSKALYEYRNISEHLISEKEYSPYYAEIGNLKRVDYNDVITDEGAFLAFYTAFFDSIQLNRKADKISDSEYFNTIYHNYKTKNKRETSNLDPFMQVIERNKEQEENLSKNDGDERCSIVEEFLSDILIHKTNQFIKSKSSTDTLQKLVKKEDGNYKDRAFVIKTDFVLLSVAAICTTKLGFNIFVYGIIVLSAFFAIIYALLNLTYYKLNKSEKEELKQLPKDFKKYLLGDYPIFNKEFFSPQISSYIGPFFKDSIVYPYVKAKYTKLESENSITNE